MPEKNRSPVQTFSEYVGVIHHRQPTCIATTTRIYGDGTFIADKATPVNTANAGERTCGKRMSIGDAAESRLRNCTAATATTE